MKFALGVLFVVLLVVGVGSVVVKVGRDGGERVAALRAEVVN